MLQWEGVVYILLFTLHHNLSIITHVIYRNGQYLHVFNEETLQFQLIDAARIFSYTSLDAVRFSFWSVKNRNTKWCQVQVQTKCIMYVYL